MLEKASQVSRRSNRVDGGRLHFQQDDNTGWSGAIGESSSEQVIFLAFPVTGGLVLFSAGAGGQTPPAPAPSKRSGWPAPSALACDTDGVLLTVTDDFRARNTRTGIRLPRSRHAPVMVSLRMRTRT